MRYFFISDVHGEFDDMMKALNDAGFNKEQDTIVSLGDLTDRGPKSKEVVEFVVKCPHRILLWGNHEVWFRQIICGSRFFGDHDRQNGVLDTMKSFDKEYDGNLWDSIERLQSNHLLQYYFSQCHYAVRWSHLIGTHAWLPIGTEGVLGLDFADPRDWHDAIWAETAKIIKDPANFPDRKIIVGHWHAWRLRPGSEVFKYYSQIPEIDFSTYETDKFIAIDGCTNISHKVNVYVMKTDEEPEIIDAVPYNVVAERIKKERMKNLLDKEQN